VNRESEKRAVDSDLSEEEVDLDLHDGHHNENGKEDISAKHEQLPNRKGSPCDDKVDFVTHEDASLSEDFMKVHLVNKTCAIKATDLDDPLLVDNQDDCHDYECSGSEEISPVGDEDGASKQSCTDVNDAEANDTDATNEVSNQDYSNLDYPNVSCQETGLTGAQCIKSIALTGSSIELKTQAKNCDIKENKCTYGDNDNERSTDSVEKVTGDTDKNIGGHCSEKEMNKLNVTAEDHTSGTGATEVTDVIPTTRKKIMIKLTTSRNLITQLYDDLEDHESNFKPSYESDLEDNTIQDNQADDLWLSGMKSGASHESKSLEYRKEGKTSSCSGTSSSSSGSGSSSSDSGSSSDSSDEEDSSKAKNDKPSKDDQNRTEQESEEIPMQKHKRPTHEQSPNSPKREGIQENGKQEDRYSQRKETAASISEQLKNDERRPGKSSKPVDEARRSSSRNDGKRPSSRSELQLTETRHGSGRNLGRDSRNGSKEGDRKRREPTGKYSSLEVTDEEILEANNDPIRDKFSRKSSEQRDRNRPHSCDSDSRDSSLSQIRGRNVFGGFRDKRRIDRISELDRENVRKRRRSPSNEVERMSKRSQNISEQDGSSKRSRRDLGEDRPRSRGSRDNEDNRRSPKRSRRENEAERTSRRPRGHVEGESDRSSKRKQEESERSLKRSERDSGQNRSTGSHCPDANSRSASQSTRNRRHHRDEGRRKVEADEKPEVKRGKFDSLTGVSRPTGRSDYCLYVKNLDKDVNDGDLYQFFSKFFRSVKTAKVVIDSRGRSKGWGYVRFYDETEQQRALIEAQHSAALGRTPIRLSLHRSTSSVSPELHRLTAHPSVSPLHLKATPPFPPPWKFPPLHIPPPTLNLAIPPPLTQMLRPSVMEGTNVLDYYSEEEDPELTIDVKKYNANFMCQNEELYTTLTSSRWTLTPEMIEQATILDMLD